MDNPVIVGFPLRGEWHAPNTPGKRIPSHGTNRLGSRYAYDFLQVDWKRKGWPGYRGHWLRYLLFGAALKDCYCWGEKIHAPFDGIIVRAQDGCKERFRAHWFSDLYVAVKSAYFFKPENDNIQKVAGNYIIMRRKDGVYGALVHLRTGSVKVSEGQRVKKGEVIGRVGHSGNSFFPHLHFQLMDSEDITTAKGLPCAFERYEIFQDGGWKEVWEGIPTDEERIRF